MGGDADKPRVLQPLSTLNMGNIPSGGGCGIHQPPGACASQGHTGSVLEGRGVAALLGPHRGGRKDEGLGERKEQGYRFP